jgi:AraC-like DNA-binding protein
MEKVFPDYATLQLITAGAVQVSYDDEHHNLTGAWVWPHFPGPRIALSPQPKPGWWNHRYLAFRGPVLAAWRAAGLWPERPQAINQVSHFVTLFDHYQKNYDRLDRWAHAEAAQTIERILVALAQEREQGMLPGWLTTIQQALSTGAVDDFNAVALARQVGMAPSTLRRRFLVATGQSLRSYAVEVRVRRAARLLLNSDSLIGALGYCDAAAFSKQFKQYLGVSPEQYRRQHI